MRTQHPPDGGGYGKMLGLILCLVCVFAAVPVAFGQSQQDTQATAPSDVVERVDPAIEAPPVLDGPADDGASPDPRQADPGSGQGGPDQSEKASEPWSVSRVLTTIWYAELFSASGSPIKLNQIVLALLIILVGLWLSKRVSTMVRQRISRVQRIDTHAAGVIQTIVFNTLAVVVVLAAMPIAGIPTTIFAVLGGAVAIGIGFGAQNLFNNLISGLILMIERPIRLGDIVEVGDHEGLIEAINNRCTRLRRSDGIDLLVPNSQFLEQPVVNWTLSDRDVRGSVVVGVAYGSPTDTVARLLRQCLDEHSLIHERPEPVVLFTEFGDNALTFEGFFWSRISRPMDLKKIQSDIRFRFDELARENSITIAFPQRDVHLDTLRPLEVRMVNQDRGDN